MHRHIHWTSPVSLLDPVLTDYTTLQTDQITLSMHACQSLFSCQKYWICLLYPSETTSTKWLNSNHLTSHAECDHDVILKQQILVPCLTATFHFHFSHTEHVCLSLDNNYKNIKTNTQSGTYDHSKPLSGNDDIYTCFFFYLKSFTQSLHFLESPI